MFEPVNAYLPLLPPPHVAARFRGGRSALVGVVLEAVARPSADGQQRNPRDHELAGRLAAPSHGPEGLVGCQEADEETRTNRGQNSEVSFG